MDARAISTLLPLLSLCPSLALAQEEAPGMESEVAPEPSPGFWDRFELRRSISMEGRFESLDPELALVPERAVAPQEGRFSSAWLSADLGLRCVQDPCGGSSLVLNPRALASMERDEARDLELWLQQGYLRAILGDRLTITLGKHVLGWGPGILYSPTNRAFSETLMTTTHREVLGKWATALAISAGDSWSLSAAAVRMDSLSIASDSASYLAVSRVEYQNIGEDSLTVGVVGGVGNRYEAHAGGYAELGLGSAWTLGVEAAVSRGQVRDRGAALGGQASYEGDVGVEALANARFGLAGGGEIGVELVYNSMSLNETERAAAAQLVPLTVQALHQGQGFHPLLEGAYAVLHARLGELPPAKTMTFTASAIAAYPTGGALGHAELLCLWRNWRASASYAQAFGPSDSTLRIPVAKIGRLAVGYTF
ncbi:MAG: hypothetical protein HY698_04685 [Deltaproteobacteria bacterium]|nr:hypothetical protein [Deltaproteobacteria bacterium]